MFGELRRCVASIATSLPAANSLGGAHERSRYRRSGRAMHFRGGCASGIFHRCAAEPASARRLCCYCVARAGGSSLNFGDTNQKCVRLYRPVQHRADCIYRPIWETAKVLSSLHLIQLYWASALFPYCRIIHALSTSYPQPFLATLCVRQVQTARLLLPGQPLPHGVAAFGMAMPAQQPQR